MGGIWNTTDQPGLEKIESQLLENTKRISELQEKVIRLETRQEVARERDRTRPHIWAYCIGSIIAAAGVIVAIIALALKS